jgi:hypothetical protein
MTHRTLRGDGASNAALGDCGRRKKCFEDFFLQSAKGSLVEPVTGVSYVQIKKDHGREKLWLNP